MPNQDLTVHIYALLSKYGITQDQVEIEPEAEELILNSLLDEGVIKVYIDNDGVLIIESD